MFGIGNRNYRRTGFNRGGLLGTGNLRRAAMVGLAGVAYRWWRNRNAGAGAGAGGRRPTEQVR